MTRIAVLASAAALLALPSCSSTTKDKKEKEPVYPYIVRGIPGPESSSTKLSFERGNLLVVARAERESDAPIFELDFRNRGAGRITLSPERMRIRSSDGAKTSGVLLLDENDETLSRLVVLSYDLLKVKVKPASFTVGETDSLVLEVRGLRDDRNEGGFDFDLLAMPFAVEDETQKGVRMPKEKEVRRKLYEETHKP